MPDPGIVRRRQIYVASPLVEEAHDYLTTMIIDPENEFENLAQHIGAPIIRAAEIAPDGLTAAASRARQHRLPLHLDLSDLEPDTRINKAAAFFAGLLTVPQEHCANTVLVAIDEGHLLAPHLAASARDAETRRLGVATMTDLCSRGRKRGISPVIATQRLAKLASRVVSEMQNVILGLNVFDRDITRAGDLLGFGSDRASALRNPPRRVLRLRAGAVQVAHLGADRTRGDTPPRRDTGPHGVRRRDTRGGARAA